MDVREKLAELLYKYFNIGDSYAYNLTRVKSAFACGTVGLDDFEEFDDETVEDIASYLIDNGVTVQEWISVDDRLPEDSANVLVSHKNGLVTTNAWLGANWWFKNERNPITHWMPLPKPPKGE